MKACWISAGVSSFIAGYLVKDTVDEFIYTHIDNQHSDSLISIIIVTMFWWKIRNWIVIKDDEVEQ